MKIYIGAITSYDCGNGFVRWCGVYEDEAKAWLAEETKEHRVMFEVEAEQLMIDEKGRMVVV